MYYATFAKPYIRQKHTFLKAANGTYANYGLAHLHF